MRALVGGFGGRGWCGSEEGLEGRKGAGRGCGVDSGFLVFYT